MGEARRRRQGATWWVRCVHAPDTLAAARAGDADALALVPVIERFAREAQAAGGRAACLLCHGPAAPADILGIVCADPADLSRAVVNAICDDCAIEAGAGIGNATHAAYSRRLHPVMGHA